MSKDARRSKNDFVSVDSAPRGFSLAVPIWKGIAVLVTFVFVSGAALWFTHTHPVLRVFFPSGDWVFAPYQGTHSVPLRIFVVSYFAAFALFAQGRLSWRLGLMSDLIITFIALCALIDATAFLVADYLDRTIHLNAIEIASGFAGYAIYAFKLLERGHMPARLEVVSNEKTQSWAVRRLIVIVFIAAVITFVAVEVFFEAVLLARKFALLGGLGPGVLLFLPLLFILLYAVARYDTQRLDTSPFCPPLTVIIPAHNEEYIIAKTIAHIDEAARSYAGAVSILVVDNNSTDRTAEIAQDSLSKCVTALGRVIFVAAPGKSHALNAAVDATQTEFVIRIDADTQVEPDSFRYAMLRMRDPEMGVVGGLAKPPGGGVFDRARKLELLVKHGFYSVGLSAVNSVVGVPGMFALYRTELPRRLGGFVQGMNGEDTDMSLRIGELGYKLIVDPRIQFVSEVPASYMHMREQRMRWFRSVYHVSARCRDLIYSPRLTVRGKVMLPFMLLNSALRAMMLPLILFGVLLFVLKTPFVVGIPWQAVLAIVVGAPACVAFLCIVLNREWRAVLCLPEYLLLRVLRSYFTLESNLSILLKGGGSNLYSAEALRRDPDKAVRDA